MKVINFGNRLSPGAKVKLIKAYKSGSMNLRVGELGVVDDVSVESFPDIGLFDLRIVHMIFGKNKLSMEEEIARAYVKKIGG